LKRGVPLSEELKAMNLLHKDLSIKDFWEESHRTDNSIWLTGSGAENLFIFHEILDEISNGNLRVLNIGVGLGHCTEYLNAQGNDVWAVDISSVALARVKHIVSQGLLNTNLKELPDGYFHKVIYHLVAQHQNDEEMLNVLREAIRSLNKDLGKLYLQFAYNFDFEKNNVKASDLAIKGGGVCRTPAHVCKMIEEAGGIVESIQLMDIFEEYGSAWFKAVIIPRMTRV
jgi:hypothetical protein